MWLEIEIMLRDRIVNWQELGIDNNYDYARRMIRAEDIYYLQELHADVQALQFHDGTSVYIRGNYEELRDKLLQIQNEEGDLDL
jgi:hypothetical protein